MLIKNASKEKELGCEAGCVVERRLRRAFWWRRRWKMVTGVLTLTVTGGGGWWRMVRGRGRARGRGRSCPGGSVAQQEHVSLVREG
jgi:hypothetical protein